ncbi:uncharacterized protein [Choristoneura fumiferana]|uniref:uncharacterized protein n=1 Tax=Choristoneura fumiferana TaxID=7141 RepID=UPI003D15ADE6
MSCPFNDEQLGQLKMFVELCKNQPLLLQHPKIAFFKDYIISLAAGFHLLDLHLKVFLHLEIVVLLPTIHQKRYHLLKMSRRQNLMWNWIWKSLHDFVWLFKHHV